MGILDSLSKLGTGQTLETSAPLHAASIHIPFVFLTTSFLLNSIPVLPGASKFLDAVKLVPATVSMKEIARFSKVCTIVGVIGAVPALSTGMAELYQLWQNGGKNKSIPKEIRDAKMKTTLLHAGLNDVALGVAAWNWWATRGARGPMPPRINCIVSAFTLPGILFSAHLGGKLAYSYGVGVQRQGLGAQVKEAISAKSE